MSSSVRGLLSGTFFEPGDSHLVELVHQRDPAAQRRLVSLEVSLHREDGGCLHRFELDPARESLDLAETAQQVDGRDRVMVMLDARYDERIFGYRPHHYGYVHRKGSATPPLYYAVNAALGGVPDRIGATGINNFETYVFRRSTLDCYSILVGNPARFAEAEFTVTNFYGPHRAPATVVLPPRAHTEVPLAPSAGEVSLSRVEVKSLARLVTYVVGRRPGGREIVLFDHLFTYFR